MSGRISRVGLLIVRYRLRLIGSRLLPARLVRYRLRLIGSRLLPAGLVRYRLLLIGSRLWLLVWLVIGLKGTAKAVVRLIARRNRAVRGRIGRVDLLIVGVVRKPRIGAAAVAAIITIVVLTIVAVSIVTVSIITIVSPAVVAARIIPIDRAVDGSGIIERLRP